MSRRKLRGFGFSDPTVRFVMLHHYLLKSAAWRTLHNDAKALLIDVWERHNGVNNGEISYSVREAERIGISEAQASRMFAMLVDRRFLAVVKNAVFKAGTKQARTWRITAEPCGGKPATRDFMRWRPMSTEAGAENHFLVPPRKPDSSTQESMSGKGPTLVTPRKLNGPKTARAKFHPGNTSILPQGGEPPDSLQAYPLPRTWNPGRAATLEAIAAGLPPSRIAEAMTQFRDRYADVQSTDWLGLWRLFVQNIMNTEKQPAAKKFGAAS
jgi:hypothetical protein